jgi:cation:H+ antiporter
MVKATFWGIVADLVLILLGFACLTIGARWLVNGAVALATYLGVSELMIGLTVIAIGTSMPEVATSMVASLRGERDIAVGNVVGSNLFNLLLVLGLTSAIAPDGVGVSKAAMHFDIPVMVVVAVACLPVFFVDYLIQRWEGAVFLLYYAAYLTYICMNAAEHDALEQFSWIMLVFVAPLTGLTFAIYWYRIYRRRQAWKA